MNVNIKKLKPFVRLSSGVIGLTLMIICCFGFNYLNHPTVPGSQTLADKTNLGCLCFLGICFGALLTLSEIKWDWFFFYFGFLRYRVGKTVLFVMSGILTALVGKNLHDKCHCNDFAILFVEAAACLGIGTIHIFGICAFGNDDDRFGGTNTGEIPKPGSTTSKTASSTSLPFWKSTRSTTSSTNSFNNKPTTPPTSVTLAASPPVPASAPKERDPNLPSWMNI